MAKGKRADEAKKKKVKVRVKVLPHGEGLPLPEAQSKGAAGLDLVAAVSAQKPIRLARGGWALIPTGLQMELPRGSEAQVRPRSGLALKHGVTVLNSPGTIDSDYRGEVQVLLVNLGKAPFLVQRGERIAQMVVAAHQQVKIKPVFELSDSKRGAGGFGSTGKAAGAVKDTKKSALPAKARAAGSKPSRNRR